MMGSQDTGADGSTGVLRQCCMHYATIHGYQSTDKNCPNPACIFKQLDLLPVCCTMQVRHQSPVASVPYIPGVHSSSATATPLLPLIGLFPSP